MCVDSCLASEHSHNQKQQHLERNTACGLRFRATEQQKPTTMMMVRCAPVTPLKRAEDGVRLQRGKSDCLAVVVCTDKGETKNATVIGVLETLRDFLESLMLLNTYKVICSGSDNKFLFESRAFPSVQFPCFVRISGKR